MGPRSEECPWSSCSGSAWKSKAGSRAGMGTARRSANAHTRQALAQLGRIDMHLHLRQGRYFGRGKDPDIGATKDAQHEEYCNSRTWLPRARSRVAPSPISAFSRKNRAASGLRPAISVKHHRLPGTRRRPQASTQRVPKFVQNTDQRVPISIPYTGKKQPENMRKPLQIGIFAPQHRAYPILWKQGQTGAFGHCGAYLPLADQLTALSAPAGTSTRMTLWTAVTARGGSMEPGAPGSCVPRMERAER